MTESLVLPPIISGGTRHAAQQAGELRRTQNIARFKALLETEQQSQGDALPETEQYCKEAKVFGEGEEAGYVYQIISGAVRTYKSLLDGRRQINAFHLPGDIFGLENGSTHRFSAEAIVKTEVRIMRWQSLLDTGAKNLLGLINRNLHHAENHLLLLGRKTSLEKVAAFLHEMDERLNQPKVMTLPMNRRDIADYLGLTLETVSRAFATLRDEKMLRVGGPTQRGIVLLDRRRLAELDTQ